MTGMRPTLGKMRKKFDYLFDNIIQEHVEKRSSRKDHIVHDTDSDGAYLISCTFPY